jgi:hypothetical protein
LERERKMWSLVIIVWTETVKDEEQICKEKSACELSLVVAEDDDVSVVVVSFFYLCVIILIAEVSHKDQRITLLFYCVLYSPT